MTTFNPWKALKGMLSGPPQQAGKVLAIEDGIATIELPGGGLAQGRGAPTVGQTVFLRDGVIEGEALDLDTAIVIIDL